jgi:hypothetical protein
MQLWPITGPNAKASMIKRETDTVTKGFSSCILHIVIGSHDVAAQAPHLYAGSYALLRQLFE